MNIRENNLWGRTQGSPVHLLFLLVMLLNISCHKVETISADTNSDTASGEIDTSRLQVSGPCAEGETLCSYNTVYMCYSGEWQAWDNCDNNNRTCILYDDTYRCTSPAGSDGDADADTDTDADADADSSPCDGPDVDCYSACWGCALTEVCTNVVEACLSDSGCNAYYECKEEVCCGGSNICLTGTEWNSCMTECEFSTGISEASLQLFNDIDFCVACDACGISCAVNQMDDFAFCQEIEEINCPTCPCYASDAGYEELACFSWAGWGGPCTEATAACKNDITCSDLEACINDAWAFDDWQSIQAECFYNAGSAAEQLYWNYMQCIYCDACDLACAVDAGTKNCAEYTEY